MFATSHVFLMLQVFQI